MPRGGVRPGSGRKKGSVAKIDKEAREAALSSGLTPLDYLLGVMRDTANEQDKRIDAAKAAAPYVHAKLIAQHNSGDDKPKSLEDWLAGLD